jgi:hypothetical protein
VPNTTCSPPPFKAKNAYERNLLDEGWRPTYDDILKEYTIVPPKVQMEFVPHKDAPLFSSGEEGMQTMKDLVNELTSSNPQITPEVKELVRQASLVSLYFFLKYVAGAYGPYSDLSDHIHVDVANFRQKMLNAGARGAVFLPRSYYKSTVCSHGADAWELLRDPNLRIGLAASNSGMAAQFMAPAKDVYENNDLVRLLFPDHCARKGEKGNVLEKTWNSQEIVMPNRTIFMPEPSIKAFGAGGAAAGNHFDLLNVDDLVSEQELDSDRGAGADMIKKGQWFSANQETLLIAPRKSRVFLCATRYSLTDPYEQVFREVKNKHGYWRELPYEVDPSIAVWDIYYRKAIEDGKFTFPEKVGEDFLERIKKKDAWTYYTQYLNDPFSASVNEFAEYKVQDCELSSTEYDGYAIHYYQRGEHKKVRLEDCEVLIGIDPNGTERKKRNDNSRAAIVVRARDKFDNRFYIDGIVGYFPPSRFFDNIFRLGNRYRKYLRATNFEGQGPFKMMFAAVRDMQREKGHIKLRMIGTVSNKENKIRTFIEPLLQDNKVFACKNIKKYIDDELATFPGGMLDDTLDAMELADRHSVRPTDDGEGPEYDEYDRRIGGYEYNRHSATGY